MTVKRRVIYNLNGFKVFGRFMAKIARKFVCIMLIKDTWGGISTNRFIINMNGSDKT